MSWGDFARTDYAADDPGRQERGDYLVERDVAITGKPFGYEQFSVASTALASWQDANDCTIKTPDYAAAGWFLHGKVWVKVAAGSGGMVRLTNVTDGNDGTAQTGISDASYVWSDDLSVQVDVGPHASVNIKVQIQGDGVNLMYANLFAVDTQHCTFWWASS